jgi:hypothetical protein
MSEKYGISGVIFLSNLLYHYHVKTKFFFIVVLETCTPCIILPDMSTIRRGCYNRFECVSVKIVSSQNWLVMS